VNADIVLPVLIPLIFYIFLGAIILVPVVLHYRNKEASQRLVRDAIAKGQQLDPALIERLIPPPRPLDPRGAAFGFLVPGVILATTGFGLAASAVMFPAAADNVGDQLTGAVITGSMGVGFLLLAAIAFGAFRPRPKE
jgi:hypothetical protein